MWMIFLNSLSSILVIFLNIFIGIFLFRYNIINKQFCYQISKIIFCLFLPCLLFLEVSRGIKGGISSIIKLWTIPLFSFFHIFCGVIIGFIILNFKKIYGKDKFNRNLLICCTSFQNVLYIPLIFIDSLLSQENNFLEINNIELIKAKAVSYIGFYIILWEFLLWTFCFHFLKSSSNSNDYQILELTNISIENNNNSNVIKDIEVENDKIFYQKKKSFRKIIFNYFGKLIKFFWDNPPLIALFFSIIIGMFPFIQENFITSPKFPLLTIFPNLLELLASIASPMALIVIGSNLAQFPKIEDIPILGIIIVCILKLIILPLITIGILILILHFHLFSNNSLIFYLVILIESTTPVTADIVIQTQLLGKGQNKASAITFYQYIFSIITIPLFTSFYLYLARDIYQLPIN